MKHPRLTTLAYLLWAIALVLSSLLVALAVLAIDAFVIVDGRDTLVCILILIPYLAIAVLAYKKICEDHLEQPSVVHLLTLVCILVYTQACTAILTLISIDALCIAVGIIFLVGLLVFVALRCMRLIKHLRCNFALKDSYPRNRKVLIKILQGTDGPDIRLRGFLKSVFPTQDSLLEMPRPYRSMACVKAISLLPFEGNELAVRQAALEHGEPQVRLLALEKLPYPREREALATVAKDEKRRTEQRLAALAKMPYPQERDLLALLAESFDYCPAVRFAAQEKLPYPEERELLVRIATSTRRTAEERLEALRKLPYPEEQATLAQIATNARHTVEEHLAALRKLPYPEERETIAKAVLCGLRETKSTVYALEKLCYPQDREAIAHIASSSKDPNLRLCALSKLPLSETAVYEEIIAKAEESVRALSGNIVPDEKSELCDEAKALKRLYKLHQEKDRLQVSHRSKTTHEDHSDHEDWWDIPLCVGGDHTDETHCTCEEHTTWYRDFTILPTSDASEA